MCVCGVCVHARVCVRSIHAHEGASVDALVHMDV